jgi:hypothetical protein
VTVAFDTRIQLACLEEHFLAAGDRRAIFASVYTLTTLKKGDQIKVDRAYLPDDSALF